MWTSFRWEPGWRTWTNETKTRTSSHCACGSGECQQNDESSHFITNALKSQRQYFLERQPPRAHSEINKQGVVTRSCRPLSLWVNTVGVHVKQVTAVETHCYSTKVRQRFLCPKKAEAVNLIARAHTLANTRTRVNIHSPTQPHTR